MGAEKRLIRCIGKFQKYISNWKKYKQISVLYYNFDYFLIASKKKKEVFGLAELFSTSQQTWVEQINFWLQFIKSAMLSEA